MTTRIQILPENLCNKIAAGEVVERPASVVKELIENSLDAGASEVVIEVEKGGKRLVRVSDDGCGMGREDLFLCLERHATSKIKNDHDLFQLQTLGFRGEALPSIAAVSRVLLRSRTLDEEAGWELYLEGGTVRRADAVGAPAGTSIEVRDLFYKLPARKKFLRRDETELGHIGDVVTKQALARPEVGFRLRHHDRSLIEVFPNQSLLERTGALLGRSLLRDLVEIDQQRGELSVRGLVSTPSVNRATSAYIYTFINGRYIRDRVVQHAVTEAYRQLLPRGRYPVVVLFLQLAPELVDVNVHPTKHEVRFRQQGEVHDALVESIKSVMRDSAWLQGPNPLPRSPAPAPAEQAVEPIRPVPQVREPAPSYRPPEPLPTSRPEPLAGRSTPPPAAARPETIRPLFEGSQGFFTSLQILGQYHQSYLLCQHQHDLVIIDQHAAHERIGFERLKHQWYAGRIESQQLLFPVMLELGHREANQLQLQLERLAQLGFEIDPFGGNSFAIKGIPQVLAQTDVTQLVRDVVAELVAVGTSDLVEAAIDKVLILMACHGMVRANQALTAVAQKALLEDLDTIDFSAQCPHGRPVMYRMGLAEIERLFKRS